MVYTKLTNYSQKNDFRGLRQPNLLQQNELTHYNKDIVDSMDGILPDRSNRSGENELFYNNWGDDSNVCSCRNNQGQSNIPCSVNRSRYYCSETCPASTWTKNNNVETNKLLTALPRWAEKESSIWLNTDNIGRQREQSFINKNRVVYSGSMY